jgi:hypothetical protein
MHTLTLIPIQVATTRPEEDNSNNTIDFVDGAGVYLSPFHAASANLLNLYPLWFSTVPPSPPLLRQSSIAHAVTSWNELSMVGDVVAELQCYSLPYGLDEYHFKLARCGGIHKCLVIDEDEEAKGLD